MDGKNLEDETLIDGCQKSEDDYKNCAIVTINKLGKLVIPQWMEKFPFNYTICFLFISIGLALLRLAWNISF